MNKEKKYFIYWIFLNLKFIHICCWLFSKLLNRLPGRSKYGFRNYPETIKKVITYDYHMEKPQWVYGGNLYEKDVSGLSINSIKLAGMNLPIKENRIPWKHHFDDPEDLESLHRWNWILYLLSEKKYSNEHLIGWFSFQAEEWIKHFQMELEDIKTASLDRWESYTAGERISNGMLFFYLTKSRPSDHIIHSLFLQTRYLINHMEYKGEATGNHILNNARAIYIAGASLNIHKWCQIAKEIIFREVPKMVTVDGFMREGSSHYHFLFTRWFLEVHHFADKAKDDDLTNFLLPWLKCLLIQCYFFLVFDTEQEKWRMPLFGDISPDFIPSWLMDIPWSKQAQKIHPPEYSYPGSNKHNEGKWIRLWDEPEYNHQTNIPVFKGTKIHEYKNSGWYRCDHGKYTLFLRGERENSLRYVGHFHQDLYHFCLFYKGMEIFIDGGRKTYNTDEWGNFGISPEAHNTVLIDGIGSVPFSPHRYPVQYFRSENNIDMISTDENNCQIKIESDCFHRLMPPVDFSRKIILKNKTFSVEDFFKGKKKKFEIKTFFHWVSNSIITPIDKKSWRIKIENNNFIFHIECEKSLNVVLVSDKNLPAGSVSRMYGHSEEAPVFIIETLTELPLNILYHLSVEPE